MNIVYNSDDRQIERKSSIDQYSNFLSVYRQGGQIPIAFDLIESITCDGIKSRKTITHFGGYNGYRYPIAHCTRDKLSYLLTDKKGLVTKKLPECQGDGEYNEYVDESIVVNADNKALGEANRVHYRVGLDYYQAKKTLPSVN